MATSTPTARAPALVLAAWLTLGLLESAKAWINLRLAGRPVGWAAALVGNLPWWLAWAALTPVIAAAGRRWRVDTGRARVVAAHLLASLVVAATHHLVVGTLYYLTTTRGTEVDWAGAAYPMTLAIQLRIFFAGYFVVNVLTYWAILAGYYALEYHRRTRDGELRAARLERDLHQARLETLRMELNPHFLYNTLNTVAALVEQQRYDAAVQMLARLGEMLRTTLDHAGDQQVTLRRELEFLEIYLAIVRERYCDRLSVVLEVEPDAAEALVPTLILQPLVENAVRHGIARRTGPGRITVRGRVRREALELTVTDRAEGPSMASAPARGGNGIGLTNTRERLEQLYGAACALELEPLPDGRGTAVRVCLPLAAAAAS